MHLPNQKSINIDGIDMKELYIDGTLIWKSGYKNWVKFSTEADGKTIYNNGLGYKDGYRIRSGGAEASDPYASHTGFIKASAGQKVRLSGYDVKYTANANAINVYDKNHNNLGQITAGSSWSYGIFEGQTHNWDDVILEKSGVYYWVVPEGFDIEYIRVTGRTSEGGGIAPDGSKMIVTVNEEIEL